MLVWGISNETKDTVSKAQSGDGRGSQGPGEGRVKRSPGNNGLLGGAFSMLDP